jgi:TetR/AcrR family transcriptional regulator, transcriptional repressor for nem operon
VIAQAPTVTGDETRRRIVEAAFQLFHEQGYHATGVATILRQAGVHPGSMYHAFPGKETLLENVLEYALELLGPAVMDPVEAATDDPIERIFALMAQYREGMARAGCHMGCPIGNLALEVSDDHTRARALIHRNFENWTGHVESWLEAAGERLPRELDRSRLARFVLTVMEGGLMQARAAGDLAPFDESVAQLRDYFDCLAGRAGSATGAAGAARAMPENSPARGSRNHDDDSSDKEVP